MDQNWPAQSSELWPIEKITPYARNSRTHSDEQVAQIAASIREWGWTNPILVDEDGHWAGDRKQTTVWHIAKPKKNETGHGTQKPVECMKRPIENNSSPGQAVYEPFSGSGTTIIAGEMTGRTVHAIELNPAYIDVAVKRWQDFTGKAATLEGDGRTFDEIAGGRIAEAA